MTGSVLQHAPTARDAQPRVLTFPGDNMARLGRQDHLFLSIELSYITTVLADQKRLWRAETPGYIYELLDRDRRPIVSYHWHPVGQSHVITPHLHVGCRAGIADLSKVHLPTGPVTLIDVIRCAISEFGVQPLRTDWRAVLDRADQALTNRV